MNTVGKKKKGKNIHLYDCCVFTVAFIRYKNPAEKKAQSYKNSLKVQDLFFEEFHHLSDATKSRGRLLSLSLLQTNRLVVNTLLVSTIYVVSSFGQTENNILLRQNGHH